MNPAHQRPAGADPARTRVHGRRGSALAAARRHARLSGVHSPTDHDLREIFTRTRTIAVLGAHTEVSRPAHYVPDYLHEVGYAVYPVNPALAGATLWGERVVASLPELNGRAAIDLVDVFRRPDYLMGHVPEILAMDPPPKLVWLQLGIRSDEFAAALRAAGIAVIEDRCALAEHRRLELGPRV